MGAISKSRWDDAPSPDPASMSFAASHLETSSHAAPANNAKRHGGSHQENNMLSTLMLISAAAAVITAGDAATAKPRSTTISPPAPWVSCNDADRIAYRNVPARLNTHDAFTHPIRVKLGAGQTCGALK